MRYDKGHKESTRRRIVEVASQKVRKHGIDGVGVADLMEEAGLTHGGFYSHFASKDELVREALQESFKESKAKWRKVGQEEGGLEDLIRFYLRPQHRDHPERGCIAACLAGEITRQSRSTKEVFGSSIAEGLELIESMLPGETASQDRRKTAVAVFSTLIGSLQLARSIPDAVQSQGILEAGIEAACTLAGITPRK